MPRKSDSLPINNEKLDRRVKLTAEQKEEVRIKYSGGAAIRALAREYEVSRRLIQFTLFPERQIVANANRDWHDYYDRIAHAREMKEHRDYKKRLYQKGLIG